MSELPIFMAEPRVVWSEMVYATEEEIFQALDDLDGIPYYAYSVLVSVLQDGCPISYSLLNSLRIDPQYWSQFEEEHEFDLSQSFNTDELGELIDDANYELVGELYAYDCYDLHDNFLDTTVMRASSDSDVHDVPRRGTRPSRSLSI